MTVSSAADAAKATPKDQSPNLKLSEQGVKMPGLADHHPIVVQAIKIQAGIDRIGRRHSELIEEADDIRKKIEQEGKKLSNDTCRKFTINQIETKRMKRERKAFRKRLSETMDALFSKQGQLFVGVDSVFCAVTGQEIDNEMIASIAEEKRKAEAAMATPDE